MESVGSDDNDNGVLDDDEIERSTLVCADGPEVTSLQAEGNSALPHCRLQALCDQLGLIGSNCSLQGNGSGPCP